MLLELIHHNLDLQIWNPKVTFDGENRLIIVNFEEINIAIKEDIYSAWKEWAILRDNIKYPIAIRSVGGDPIGGSAQTGDTYFLINNWKLIVDLTKVRIIGVLFSDDYETAYYDKYLNKQYPVQVSSLVNTIITKETVVTGDINTISANLTDLQSQINTRLASADYIAPNNAGIAAIKTKTDTINWQNITDLKDEAFGRWKIDTSITPYKLIFYKPDGVTELKRFNLTQDADGNYIERIPI